MSEVLEHSQERLDNIQAIDPILSALRTISMSSWQTALNRRSNLRQYRAQFGDLYQYVLPLIKQCDAVRREEKPPTNSLIALVVGSERGLIGKFNRDITDYAKEYLDEKERNGVRVKFWLLGSRLKSFFVQREIQFEYAESLSTSSLPSYSTAVTMTRQWLISYEKYHIDAVEIIYNAYHGPSKFKIQVARLLPLTSQNLKRRLSKKIWPPPIIETDPKRLYTQMVKQETSIHLFDMLLESAASEHSARYTLMEEAVQNSQRLIEELKIDLQTIRRQEITREMQELAVAAGLLKK